MDIVVSGWLNYFPMTLSLCILLIISFISILKILPKSLYQKIDHFFKKREGTIF